MQLKMSIVDAFTSTVFKGNSAAVLILHAWLNDELMQAIAIENNLSETAFLVKSSEGIYDIRWFSPIMEIGFCGHATLASAAVLFGKDTEVDTVRFRARAVGLILAKKLSDGYISMDFPNRKPELVQDVPEALLKGLSISPVEVYKNDQAYFVIYDNETDVLEVTQNTECIETLYPHDVAVTAAGKDFDFISRYFWPASGGEEDPVTGSAHTGLAPLWAEKLGRNQLSAFQASKRGGYLKCLVDEDRVIVSGQTAVYLEGIIHV